MFCTKCGASVLDRVGPCPTCGIEVGASPATNSQSVKARPKPLIWSLAFVAGIAIFALVGSVYMGRRSGVNAEKYGPKSLGESTAEDRSSSMHHEVCDLVTRQEVASATGIAIVNSASDDDGELCTYTPAEEGVNTVTVQVAWEGGTFALNAGAALMKSAAGGAEFRQPIQGIGDEAFVLGVGPERQNELNSAIPPALKTLATLTTGPLMFRKGDTMVTVTANFVDNKLEAEKAIAMKIAGRL
jgi:hypothetical protein